MRGPGTLLVALLGIILAGCGSSAAPAATPTPAPRKTADVAALQSRQATAIAIANKTAVAVQNVARTAVARLQSTANTQSTAQASSQATAAARSRRPTATATRAVRVNIAPTPTPRSTATPRPTATRPAKPRATARTAQRPLIALASLVCCNNGEFKGAGERTSLPFTVDTSWLLRWSTTCGAATRRTRPSIYIGVIPVGSKNPVRVIHRSMPANGQGTGIARLTVRGRFYLDIISPCRRFSASIVGRKGARVSTVTQSAAVAEAAALGQGPAFRAVRRRLVGRAPALGPSRTRNRARSAARARFILHVGRVLTKTQAISDALRKGADTLTSATAADFDPAILTAARADARTARRAVRKERAVLKRIPALRGHATARTLVARALRHVDTASDNIDSYVAAIESGNPDAATTALAAVNANLKTAATQLERADAALKQLRGG